MWLHTLARFICVDFMVLALILYTEVHLNRILSMLHALLVDGMNSTCV